MSFVLWNRRAADHSCARAGAAGAGEAKSMLAWQVDRAVGEPERDRVEREVSVRNLLREDHVPTNAFRRLARSCRGARRRPPKGRKTTMAWRRSIAAKPGSARGAIRACSESQGVPVLYLLHRFREGLEHLERQNHWKFLQIVQSWGSVRSSARSRTTRDRGHPRAQYVSLPRISSGSRRFSA